MNAGKKNKKDKCITLHCSALKLHGALSIIELLSQYFFTTTIKIKFDLISTTKILQNFENQYENS